METITHSKVQELVRRLPETKLSLAYRLLLELTDEKSDTPSPQIDFMILPLDERRRIMTQQAKQMVSHYKDSADERQEWQSGDFMDEY